MLKRNDHIRVFVLPSEHSKDIFGNECAGQEHRAGVQRVTYVKAAYLWTPDLYLQNEKFRFERMTKC